MRSNREWTVWGKKDPVRYTAGPRAGDDNVTYSMARADWSRIFDMWRHLGVRAEKCLEVGCGVGRFTVHIGRDFRSVVAVDVSQEILDYNREHLRLSNIEYRLVGDGSIPFPDDYFDGVFSIHTLSILSEGDIISYLREFYRCIAPGGSVLLEIPMHLFPSLDGRTARAGRAIYRAKCSADRIRVRYRRWRLARGKAVHQVQSTSVDFRDVRNSLREIGYENIQIWGTYLDITPILHLLVFAEKPDPGRVR